jgi:hypothetical protein
MNSRLWAVLCLVLGLALAPVGRAAPPAIAQTEINYLLGFVESSACEFFRNGSWYGAKTAAAHLRDKYQMLLATGSQIYSAEDFIEEAATKSSLSGRPYQVRCNGKIAVTANEWLRDVLARYRAHTELRAPRPERGALGTDIAGQVRLSVVLPDLKVAVNRSHVFGVARNGHCLVGGFLGPSAAGQPYDSIPVGVDMNAPQAG